MSVQAAVGESDDRCRSGAGAASWARRSTRLRRRAFAGACALVLAAATVGTAASARFVARLADGRLIEGEEVGPWHDAEARPRLAGVDLLDDDNPMVWLRDTALPTPRSPAAFIEFFGGDVLPGQVVGPGDSSPFVRELEELEVEAEIPLEPPARPSRGSVRIVARWVRRVVWVDGSGVPYRPGTLIFRDGRQLRFQSARWGSGELALLLEEGVSRVAFADIAEVHLPPRDGWDALCEQLAVLTPSGAGRLLRLETVDGLRATTSLGRFLPSHHGDASLPDSWLHVVQPAWCRDALWVPHRTIRQRVLWAASRLPLSILEPLAVERRATFGGSWSWERDRAVGGGPLRSGAREAAWGIGVHAHCALRFALPSGALSVRSGYGLDRSVGGGGCAVVELRVRGEDGSERRLHRGPVLVGSAASYDSGDLAFGDVRPGDQLVLVADDLATERPTGADPFDIRDRVDWLEPVLEIEAAALRREIRARLPAVHPALGEWGLAEAAAGGERLEHRPWLERRRDPCFRSVLRVEPGVDIRLMRRLEVDPRRPWLFASATRLPGSAPAWIELWIDGTERMRFDIPESTTGADPEALLWRFDVGARRSAEVELRVRAADGVAWTDWGAVVLVERAPGLLPVFEDDAGFLASVRPRGRASASLDWRDVHSGSAALVVSGGDVDSARIDGIEVPIRRDPRHGEFRFLRFAWRKAGGSRVGLRVAHDGRWGPPEGTDRPSYAYDAGTGPGVFGPTRRVGWSRPDRWEVVTRDLAADFGEFVLTGLGFRSPDGGVARFDHVWLARTREDLDRIAVEPPLLPSTRSEAMGRRLAPAVSDSRDGYERLVAPIAPGFVVAGLWRNELALLESYRGRAGVLRTHPASPGRPCSFSGRLVVPAGRRSRLALAVAHDVRGDWRLLVRVDGATLLSEDVAPATSVDGWVDRAVDLTPFAGRTVDVEIVQEATGWAWEFGYWWVVALEEAPPP